MATKLRRKGSHAQKNPLCHRLQRLAQSYSDVGAEKDFLKGLYSLKESLGTELHARAQMRTSYKVRDEKVPPLNRYL